MSRRGCALVVHDAAEAVAASVQHEVTGDNDWIQSFSCSHNGAGEAADGKVECVGSAVHLGRDIETDVCVAIVADTYSRGGCTVEFAEEVGCGQLVRVDGGVKFVGER